MICPNCKTEITLTDLERAEIFKLLTSDKEFMRELGKAAAAAYLNLPQEG